MKSKSEMFWGGVTLMREFCEHNALPEPEIAATPRDTWRFPQTCAYYRKNTITICVDRCSHIGTANRAWSYPGYVIDRTPYGVIQHELGHHVDWHRSSVRGSYGGEFSKKLRQITREPQITSYAPNDWEWFAEIFRLFVTNSDLLKSFRPKTHAKLRELFKPVVDAPWREVLKDAPERTIEMAERKIA